MSRTHTAMGRAGALVVALLAPLLAHGAVSDQVTRNDFTVSVCNIAQLAVKYTLDEAFGEPLITSSMQWNAGANTPPDCLPKQTSIYLRIRRTDGAIGYVKLSPEIVRSRDTFGPTATESPFWNHLICDGTSKTSLCLASDVAKTEYARIARVEGFEVVAEASIAQQLNTSEPSKPQKARSTDDEFASDFSFDSLLEKAIDSTIVSTDTGAASGSAAAPAPAEKTAPQPAEPAVATPEPTRAELAQLRTEQEEQLAENARNNVVTLVTTTFAQYKAPAHSCESDRTVANWVRVTGRCGMNFRTESSHDFLCENDGKPRKITTTRTTDVDFGHDIAEVAPLRVSAEGWVALVIEFKKKLGKSDAGNSRIDRWQFTGTGAQLEAMSSLASSLATLKQYCERQAGEPG